MDGTICGDGEGDNKVLDDESIRDWSEKWNGLLLLFDEVNIVDWWYDGVESNCPIHKLLRIVEAAKRKRDHNWACCWPNTPLVVVENDWINKGEVCDTENGFELNVLFGDDPVIGRM